MAHNFQADEPNTNEILGEKRIKNTQLLDMATKQGKILEHVESPMAVGTHILCAGPQ